MSKKVNYTVEDFYFFKPLVMWQHMKSEHFSFWMICAYLFVEFFRPQSLFPALDFLPWAQLFLVGAMVGAFMDSSVKWVKSPANTAIIIFGLLIFISSFTAYFPEFARKYWINFYSWMIVYFLSINIVNTRQRYYIFLMIFIVCAAKIAIGTSKTFAMRGFGFTKWGLYGPKGFFQNSSELAILMLTLFPLMFLIYFVLKDKIKNWEKYLILLCSFTPILTIIGASSRGAQLAMVVQLLLMFRKSIFRFKSLIGVIILSVGLWTLLPEEQKARFESSGDDKSSQQRLLYWEHGWTMMKENPFLGVGYYNFIPYYERHFPGDMLYGAAQLPHNIFIQVGTDTGFTGVAVFMFMILYCFYLGWKTYRLKAGDPFIKTTLIGNAYGILGFVVAGQFVTVTYYPYFWIGMAFLVIANNLLSVETKTNTIGNS